MLSACFLGAGDDDDDDESGSSETCDDCSADQVCVGNYDFDAEIEEERCEGIPAACGDVVDCSVTECAAALYDLCESGWIGVGCSDTYPPAVVSCNEDRVG
jgi:hypothetical protein